MARETITPRMTDAQIAAIVPGQKERLLSCEIIPNLYLVVSPKGLKRWAWISKGCGKIAIAPYAHGNMMDARTKANEYNALREQGLDPKGHLAKLANDAAVEAKRVASNTVQSVVDAWVEDKRREDAARKTIHEYIRQLNYNMIPAIGDRAITEVTRADIKAIQTTIIDRGARSSANRVLVVMKQFFEWAVMNQYIATSPAATVPTVKETRKNKDRALSVPELATLYRAAAALPEDDRDALRLLILTGTRKNEACAARMEDFDGAWWVVPPSEYTTGNGHTFPVSHSKTEHEHPMPLPPLALAIFEARKDKTFLFHPAPHKFIFPDLSKQADVAIAAMTGARFPAWNIHDIRAGVRTALSSDEMDEMLEREGNESFSEQIGEIVLNHSLGKLNRTYNKSRYGRQIGRALAAWERLLNEEIARQTA
jgi:integrase